MFRLKEGEAFYMWPESEEEWWYVEPLDLENNADGGYVLKDQISAYFLDEDISCACLKEKEKPLIHLQDNSGSIVVCGSMLQRQTKEKIIAQGFQVISCSGQKQLAYYGPTETCSVYIRDESLVVESLKKLPTGPNWEIKRLPISRQVLSNRNLSKRELVAKPIVSEEQALAFLSELQSFKGKGYDNEADYRTILLKLLSAGLAGHQEAANIIQNADQYFGFEFSTYFFAQYANAKALIDWKNK